MDITTCEVRQKRLGSTADVSSLVNYPEGDGLYVVLCDNDVSGVYLVLIREGTVNPMYVTTATAGSLLSLIGTTGQHRKNTDHTPVLNGYISENAFIKALAVAQNPELIKDIDLYS